MRLRFRSLLSRIIWLHVAALVGVSIAVSSAAYFLLSSTAANFEERNLQDHATAISQYLRVSGGKWSLQLPPDLQTLYSRGYGGYALAVTDSGDSVVFSSLPDRRVLFTPAPQEQALSFFQQRRGKAVYYGINDPVRKDGSAATIQIGQDLDNPDVILDDVVANFLSRIAWVIVPIFALLLAVDVLIVKRALRPILNASQMAQSIEPNRIDLRLPTDNLPQEVLPLIGAINQALDRLERGFQMQRDFTTDAAHELRTPLTILRTRIDMLDRRIAAAIRPDMDRIVRILDQLLEMAELESFSIGADERADLRAVCSEVVGAMAPLALSNAKDLALTGAPDAVWVHGNSEMLFRAIRNLVENAIRHTPPDTCVEVDVNPNGTVLVMDRGPGVPPSQRELIFHRFWRGDRFNAGSAGLGLSIVARMVEIHGGTVAMDERAGGGAIFAVRLDLTAGRPDRSARPPAQPVLEFQSLPDNS